jgi:hypothetical protein
VETLEHALFFCAGSIELLERRDWFSDTVCVMEPRILQVTVENATNILKALIFRRDTVCQVAKFAHKVFSIFVEEPMVWPEDV